MIIDRAIVATSPMPLYYEFWPIVARGWRNIKIEPTVAAIGGLNLNHGEGTVIKFPQIEGIDPGFIAQVIRFIIPCFFPEEVSIIADIDMVPLSINYFSANIRQYDNDDIIVFSSDAHPNELRYPMCYIAARGKYFQQIIGLNGLDLNTIINFIKDLHSLNLKWDTDELFFAKKLHGSPLLSKVIFLKRGWNPMAKNRIDRGRWQYNKWGLVRNKYIDAHCVRPLHSHQKELKDIFEYVNHGSNGKVYGLYLLKKPLKALVHRFGKQHYQNKNLFNITGTRNLDRLKTRIISFSLYGNAARYTQNLDEVIRSYHKILPGWKCRVYVGSDVDEPSVKLLTDNGCELIMMQGAGVDARYMLWRFLAIEDKDAEAVIIRDLDSVCTAREGLMISQWQASGKTFHVIRDHLNHNTAIMGGLWGAKKNSINIKKNAREVVLTNNYGIDQVFLQQMIYPKIKDDVMIHDSFPRFPHEEAIIIPFDEDGGFAGEIYTDASANQRDKNVVADYHKRCFSIK
ncbi:hypothetical protein HQ865_11955 [Mucilaginibacter mali]|uniref:Uncharacterized protein n=1 Tax=Mucilaginibacter mali TaxID=2740462 RepID=A0A7D4UDE3_9SPHI|nr:hypothetical protein [Mucilaginibacter mali]QKJ30439.1 hypothetical protein HQ865_11955 [Mucilaginibacter mali]